MRLSRTVLLLFLSWLTLAAAGSLRAQRTTAAPFSTQMTSVINSLADDADAHPWDDPDTEADESIDGTCKDQGNRCTLRAALEEAWGREESANITFSPSLIGALFLDNTQSGFGIPPGSTIKGYEQSVTIVGYAGYSLLMGVDSNTTIQGLAFSDATDAIFVGGRNNLIGGDLPHLRNVFTGMGQSAILLAGDNNRVQGNFIGLNNLNQADGNQWGVFVVNSSSNIIGGSAPGEGNVISGNVQGIALVGDSVEGGLTYGGNQVIGNYIGTDTTGTEARPNQYGILTEFHHNLTIGSTGVGLGNVISGNSVAGISLGPMANTTTISGNKIGTDPTGVYGIANRTGIILGPGSMNAIVEQNLISSNQWEGVLISGYDAGAIPSVRHRLSGNSIVLNGTTGVLLSNAAKENIIGSSLSQNYPPNTIQYNGQGSGAPSAGGVVAHGFSGLGIPRANTIRKNDFMDNAPGGIRFDQVAGLQDDIQPPVITGYMTFEDGAALIEGTHHRPGSRIDIYTAGYSAGPTYQGRQWLGSTTVAGDSTFAIAMDSCLCSRIIATATDAAANTSEFSKSFPTRRAIVSADLNLNSGWNMVSVPATVSNFQTSVVFSGSTVGAYSYSGSYNPATTLATGNGYWVRYPAPTVVNIQGYEVPVETVAILPGWNLIGSLSQNLATSSVTSEPGGLVTSNFFSYNLAYEIADTIRPGSAYWVKASAAGSLILSTLVDTGAAAGRIVIRPGNELPPPPPAASADDVLPSAYALQQNYPNPFNPVTRIGYDLPEGGRVTLKVFDLLGREVATLVDGDQEAGRKSVTWNAAGAGSGVYFYRLTAGSYSETRHLMLTR